MSRQYEFASLLLSASLMGVLGCDGDDAPTGPMETPGLVSISPRGGAMGVPVGTSLELHWSEAMGTGMEQYLDMHVGDLGGPIVPMICDWTANRTTLLCSPLTPLQPGTQYVVHVGGGMVGADGQVVDMMQHGPGFGGQWIQGGMMGHGHAGMAWSGMGGNWRHSNGSFGMAFFFTTD